MSFWEYRFLLTSARCHMLFINSFNLYVLILLPIICKDDWDVRHVFLHIQTFRSFHGRSLSPEWHCDDLLFCMSLDPFPRVRLDWTFRGMPSHEPQLSVFLPFSFAFCLYEAWCSRYYTNVTSNVGHEFFRIFLSTML